MEQLLYVLAFCLYIEGEPCEIQSSTFELKEVCEAVRDDMHELADLPGTDKDAEYLIVKDCILEKRRPPPLLETIN